MKKDLKVLELFSGIRALSVALEKIGINYEIIDSVEIDKFAVMSQNAMFNTNFKPQDIREWDKDVEIDLLMHGSPCQDFSLAGKQAGGEEGSGTRSSLLYETIRIVEKNKPKVVIWENVKNVLSVKHRDVFDDYLLKMEELGYTNHYQVLNARNYGIPQNRERVFTISIRNDVKKEFKFPEPFPLKIRLKDVLQDNPIGEYNLFGNEYNGTIKQEKMQELLDLNILTGYEIVNHSYGNSKDGKIEKLIMTKNNIAPTITTRGDCLAVVIPVDDKYYLSEEKMKRIAGWKSQGRPLKKVKGLDSVIPTITARSQGDDHGQSIYISNRNEEINIEEQIKNDGKIKEYRSYISWEDNKGRINTQDHRAFKDDCVSGTVPAMERGIPKVFINNDEPKIDIVGNYSPSGHSASRIVDQGGIAPTMMENHGTVTAVKNDFSIRKLTPLECWRLMGFSDEHFFKAKAAGVSDAQLYKQAGNSIVVNVLEAILKSLFSIN